MLRLGKQLSDVGVFSPCSVADDIFNSNRVHAALEHKAGLQHLSAAAVRPAIMWKVGCFLSCIAVTRSFSSIPSCSSDEAELAGKRLQTLLALNSVFTSFGASDAFSLGSFISELGPLVTPEFSLTVPYGAGTYAGLNDAAEYLSLQFSSVNVGLSSFNLSDTAGVLPAMSIDGDEYTLKSNFVANFFPTVTPSWRLPMQSEVVVTFAPCRLRSAHPPATITCYLYPA